MAPYRVGLSGGIGSGKSEVARYFSEEGAFVVDYDVLARVVVAPGSDGYHEIAARWPSVMTALGEIDRAALGKIVFSDEHARQALNTIVHPRVRLLGNEMERQAARGQLIVHVVPLLFETGYDRRCDATILVVAPLEERVARVMARDGLSEADVRKRISSQILPEAAARRATYVLHNDSDLGTLRARAVELARTLTAQARESVAP